MIAEMLEGMVDEAMTTSTRSLYAAERKIGVSDIGGCHEYVRLMLTDTEFSDPRQEYGAAFVGTAVGKELAEAFIARHPGAVAEAEVEARLTVHGNMNSYSIGLPGHADVVYENTLIDFKTKNGLSVIRREGVERKHQYQVTLYAKALIDAGKLTEDCTLAIAYYDRSGVEAEPYVVEWTYDPSILDEAMDWINTVVYAIDNEEKDTGYLKDKPRDWCFSWCPYATVCRGSDTDVEGVIEDPGILTAIDLYRDAHARETQAKKEKRDAAAALRGAAGHTPDGYTLRWIFVGESVVPEHRRKEYQRIDIRKPK